MAQRIGTAALILQGDSSGLVRSARESARALERTTRQTRLARQQFTAMTGGARRLVSSLTSLRSIAGLAVGGGIFGGIVRNATQAGTETLEFARAIGVTTERLQRLQFVAASDGVDFTALRTSLRTLSRAFAEAQDGVAEYRDEFEALGISVDNIGNIETIELLGVVLNRLASTGQGVRASAIATQLLGRSGLRLQAVVAELARQGITLEGAMTNVEDSFIASRAVLERVKDIEQSFLASATASIVALQAAVSELQPTIRDISENLAERIPDAARGLVGAVRLVVENLDSLVAAFQVLLSLRVALVVGEWVKALASLRAAIASLGVAGAVGAGTGVAGPLGGLIAGLATFAALSRLGTERTQEQTAEFDKQTQVLQRTVALMRERNLEFGIAERIADREVSNTLALRDQANNLIQQNIAAQAERANSLLRQTGQEAENLAGIVNAPSPNSFILRLSEIAPRLQQDIEGVGVALQRVIGQESTDARGVAAVFAEVDRLALGLRNRIATEGLGGPARDLREATTEVVGILSAERNRLQSQLNTLVAERITADTLRVGEINFEVNSLETNLRGVTEQIQAAAEGASPLVARLAAANTALREAQEEREAAAEADRKATQAAVEAEREKQRIMQESARIARRLATRLSDGIADAVTGARSLRDILQDALRNVLSAIAQQLFAPREGGNRGGILGTLIGGLAGRAGGGPVNSGVPYVVGERGPELFVPRRQGTILPSIPAAGAAGRVIQFSPVFNIQSSDGPGVQTALERAMPGLMEAAVEASRESTTRDTGRPSPLHAANRAIRDNPVSDFAFTGG